MPRFPDTSPPGGDAPRPKRLLKLVYKFILISIAVHIVGLALFGGYVIFTKSKPEEVTFEAPAALKRVEPKKREYKLAVKEQQKRASKPKLQSRLQSARIADVALPDVKANIAPLKNDMSPVPGMSGGLGEGLNIGGGIGGGQIFGVNVVASKLGVIIDVSKSTHAVIHLSIAEIQRSFGNAIMVFAPGCGMRPDNEARVLLPATLESRIGRYTHKNSKLQLVSYLYGDESMSGGLLAANRKFREFYDANKNSERVFLLYVTNTTMPIHSEGTHEAFEFLIDQGVDGIYWFADFEDEIDPAIQADLIAKLKRSNVKVYQHVMNVGKSVDNRKLAFSTETGGEIIQVDAH